MFRKKEPPIQPELWVPTCKLRRGSAAQFWDAFDALLEELDFPGKTRALCAPHYAHSDRGNPGIDPVVLFKMLLIGFFENLPSERAIASRCEDSLSIRGFLGYDITEDTPDHSTLSRFRQRLPIKVFDAVFDLVFPMLHELGLLHGRHLGADTSAMEANAAMRKLHHTSTGESYRTYVKRLAKEAGVDTEDPAAVSRFDRNRPGRTTSNKDWRHPHDPDAKVGPTKHGGVRMIYKPEHTVDMESGAILDARVLPGDQADCVNTAERIIAAERRVAEVIMPEDMDLPVETVTSDCGYYSTRTVTELSEIIPRVNIPEKKKDRNLDTLTDAQREAVLASRAVNASDEGKQLLRKRGMHVERSFAHILDCGGMRRTTLRGEENIQKRYNIAAFGYNLSLLMRVLFGCGTLKQWLAGAKNSCFSLISGILACIIAMVVPQRLHPQMGTTALVGLDI